MRSGSFESLRSVKNLERLSKKQGNNQATDQSGTVDFFRATSTRKLGRECYDGQEEGERPHAVASEFAS